MNTKITLYLIISGTLCSIGGYYFSDTYFFIVGILILLLISINLLYGYKPKSN